jgi:hypothetical protein
VRRRAFQILLLSGYVYLAVPSVASTRSSIEGLGEEFFRLFDSGQYSGATALFHYPEGYSKRERETDAKGIVDFLANLSAMAGEMRHRQSKTLDGTFITIGIGAGDLPYWSSHHQFDHGVREDYVADTSGGALGFSLNWVSVDGGWKLRSVVCNVPTARPDAKEFAEKLIKAFPSPA